MMEVKEPKPLRNPITKKLMDPGDEIVISGIAGRFPDSDNMTQFRHNLINKVDLVTDDNRRWTLDHPDIPRRFGKVNNLAEFDADFFDVPLEEAHAMDPMSRCLLEHAYEAIVDAGVNPKHLKGTNTGVFVGACLSESNMLLVYERDPGRGYAITGCTRGIYPNKISSWLQLTGPSYTIDSACSSSLFAMEEAYRAIRIGQCDAALVGGVNLCLHHHISLEFFRLGVLSIDGRSKSFDADADGYARAETIGITFLQKAKDAKRVYATVVHVKTNCDGFKEHGITFPSKKIQSLLLKELYEECQVPPSSLGYIEAHGTGTKVGDPEELQAIESVFCPGRKEPLKVGSVKSNIGHAEGAAGIGQLAKVVIACETGIIPPNLHFKRPTGGVKGLKDGTLQVVAEPTTWNGGYVGINSFGFGGANAHVLLKSNTKEKINGGIPQDDLPRLVVASGRTEAAVESLLTAVASKPIDTEFVRLLHDLHTENITGHFYRGYTIIDTVTSVKRKEIKHYSEAKRPVWFIFSGIGSQWPGMGSALLRFPVFASAIKKCDAVLKPLRINIYEILTSQDSSIFDSILHCFIGIIAMHIGLVDLLNSLGIIPNVIIGHSVGELACAYADSCITVEQTILIAYFQGLALIETDISVETQAGVDSDYKKMKNNCSTVDKTVGRNGHDGSTEKPAQSIKTLIDKLKIKNTGTANILKNEDSYWNNYVADAKSRIRSHLKNVILEPKTRSSKWLSTSIPKTQWNTSQAKLSSVEYYTNDLFCSSALFEEVLTLIPNNAITIEIGPHGQLQDLLKRSLSPKVIKIVLVDRMQKQSVDAFLDGIGKLYEVGLQPKIWKLYPEVPFPVSRGTPMISPLIKWDHSQDCYVACHQMAQSSSAERRLELNLADEEYEFMTGHVIDGRNLIPATGYLAMVWETLAMTRGELYTEVSIVFEHVKFLRATTIPKNGSLFITVTIQKESGRFEVIESGAAVVSGSVRHTSNPTEEQIKFPLKNEVEEMTTKDVYKELSLRGYQYSGLFKSIKSATINGSNGTILWNNKFVAFMDNMLQMKILGVDSRDLLVPVTIEKLTIDIKKHSDMIRSMPSNEKEFKVYNSKEYDVIFSGGIQIRGLNASIIFRKKPAGEPVLETYNFVAHRDLADVSMTEAVRLGVHLSLENDLSIKVKTLEFLESGEKYPTEELFSPFIVETLAELPMIKADVNIVTSENVFGEEDVPENINIVELKRVNAETEATILAGRNLLTQEKRTALSHLLPALKQGAFVMSFETLSSEEIINSSKTHSLQIILEKKVGNFTFLLLKKSEKLPPNSIIIKVNNEEFSWLNDLKETLKIELERNKSRSSRILLISDKNFENGLLGLINCLRREPCGELVRGILIQDSDAPQFSLSNSLYSDQLNLDLAVNVLRPKKVWGSYRHSRLLPLELRPVYHAWANQLVTGDLSSFRWLEGPITPHSKHPDVADVIYSSLNFKDVMLATGKLAAGVVCTNRSESDGLLGFEYAGITRSGRRIVGLQKSRALTNIIIPDSIFSFDVPRGWTLEEAATVPAVYCTCYFALHMCGRMKKGDKILIHAGSGGIGQAAINLALSAGCEVFATVGTMQKRSFLREKFPEIPDNHIGNSRDISFEQMIMELTNGQGVDLVLNSLADDKLQASIRCLAEGGRFLEIGKFDMANNSLLSKSIFAKGISFYGILLDRIYEVAGKDQLALKNLVQKGFNEGTVKPVNVTIFPRDEIEPAFRHMAAGKHIGKVIVKIQEENNIGVPISALPYYYCLKNRSYVILGGLGGFGLELCDWLVLRGAMHLVITSRAGIKNGYQRMRIKLWESYGVEVVIISGKDASNLKECEEILSIASKQGEVDAIFNLAVVLKDNLIENQVPETFMESFKPKAWSTKHLDTLSRKLCPKLRHFVVFSSVSCGRGNAGQTNYGMANSVMERICEKRVADGFPGLAIQWGAIGDVGLVADMQNDNKELIIGGTLQQKIISCLHELEGFLMRNHPIVASMVVAEKRAGSSDDLNVVDTVLNIMGLKDLKSISQQTPLSELGMDSMMAIEIKQTLERNFDIFLGAQDIRGLNFAKLIELNSKNSEEKEKGSEEEKVQGLKMLLRLLGDDFLTYEASTKLPTKEESGRNEIFLIPGIEGYGSVFAKIAKEIKAPATCLQFDHNITHYMSIEEMADNLLPHILQKSEKQQDFTIVGYSFGSLVAIELARKLEAADFKCKLIFVDGSPEFMKALKNQHLAAANDDELATNVLLSIADISAPSAATTELLTELKKCKSWEEKLDMTIKYAPPHLLGFTSEQHKNVCTCVYNRLIAVQNYNISSVSPLKSPITLLKPTATAMNYVTADYGLSNVTSAKVDVYTVEGNHITILDNPNVAVVINGEPLENSKIQVGS